MDGSDRRRDEIHALLQEQGPAGVGKRAVLSGWVIVTEWMDEDGERWLSKAHSATIPPWTAAGFHHEALYGDFPDADPDADVD